MNTKRDKIELLKTKDLEDYGLVSIVMPNYNSVKFIKETIDSVISQTYQNWELIIVDDCSSDNSLEIIKQYKDNRIRIQENKSNSGAAISRNNAIESAKGRWIAFLDSDDLWDSNKLLKHLQFMTQTKSSFSFTNYYVLNSNNELISKYAPSKDSYNYNDILKHCSIGCSTVIYDCEKLGKFFMPVDAIKREDFACWLKILKVIKNANCYHEFLTTYRVHTNSVSSNKFKMIKYQWNVYRKIEKISFFKSLYYMINWAIRGVFKYR